MKQKPQIGQIVVVRGVECRIIAVLPMGTIDVEAQHTPAACSGTVQRRLAS